jgi:hypothetical protein
MKRLILLVIFVAVISSLFTDSTVFTVHAAGCVVYDATPPWGTTTVDVNVTIGHSVTDTQYSSGAPLSTTTLTVTSDPFPISAFGGERTVVTDDTASCGGTSSSGPVFSDNRLNNNDAYETAAVYCEGDGSVQVYVTGSPKWILDFTASPADIAKVSTKPSQNTIIKQGNVAALSRLTNGMFQVSAPGLNPKDGNYTYSFPYCPAAQSNTATQTNDASLLTLALLSGDFGSRRGKCGTSNDNNLLLPLLLLTGNNNLPDTTTLLPLALLGSGYGNNRAGKCRRRRRLRTRPGSGYGGYGGQGGYGGYGPAYETYP